MNVWRQCQVEDKKFDLDTCSQDIDQVMFDLTPIIRDPNEQIRAKDIIRSNFRMFQINFIEKMIGELGLDSYP